MICIYCRRIFKLEWLQKLLGFNESETSHSRCLENQRATAEFQVKLKIKKEIKKRAYELQINPLFQKGAIPTIAIPLKKKNPKKSTV